MSAAISVLIDPWSNDRASLQLTVNCTSFNILSSPRGRLWYLYQNFKPLLSPQMSEEHGFFAQPPWALLLTNGLDDIFVYEKLSKAYLHVRSKKTPLSAVTEITTDQAEEIGRTLVRETEKAEMSLTHTKPNAHIKPVGLRYKYSANKSVLQPISPRETLGAEPVKEATKKPRKVKLTAAEKQAKKIQRAAGTKRQKPFKTRQQKQQEMARDRRESPIQNPKH